MSDDPATKPINLALGNLLKGVKKHGEVWLKYDETSKAAFDAAQNTLNLYECCMKADMEDTLLGETVPSIKSKLIVKLVQNLHPSLSVLRKDLDGSIQCRNRIMSCAQSFEIALRGCNLYNCEEASPTSPAATYVYEAVVSLADIMLQLIMHRKSLLYSIEEYISKGEVNEEPFLITLSWNTNTVIKQKLEEILAWSPFKK